MTTLARLGQFGRRRSLHKVAIITSGQRLTYHQLDAQIQCVAAALVGEWRVQLGEVVALLAPNCAEFVMSYFAIVQIGAVVQPIDERLSPDDMAAVLKDAGTRCLIVHGSLWEKFDSARRLGLNTIEQVVVIAQQADGTAAFETWRECPVETDVEVGLQPSMVAELMYTSGTTGNPKGVQLSHANVRAASRNSIRGFGYRSDDIIAIVMPLSHSSALNSQMIPLLQLGGTLVLLPNFQVAEFLDVLKREGVTCMRAVPIMLRLLLAHALFSSEYLPRLRLLVNSSAPIDTHTYTALKRRFPTIDVLNSYGLTEASTCTVLPDHMAFSRPDSVGSPIEGVTMSVQDAHGQIVEDGVEGEICVQGEHVFISYRQRPEATAAAFSQGWLRTGDVGYRDSEGYYYISGRHADVINCGGQKFVPRDVERCIEALPEVLEAAVTAVPHRLLGEVAKAFVVTEVPTQLDAKTIIRHCAQHLASYKIPYTVEFVPTLPKNSVGKLLRRKLSCATE